MDRRERNRRSFDLRLCATYTCVFYFSSFSLSLSSPVFLIFYFTLFHPCSLFGKALNRRGVTLRRFQTRIYGHSGEELFMPTRLLVRCSNSEEAGGSSMRECRRCVCGFVPRRPFFRQRIIYFCDLIIFLQLKRVVISWAILRLNGDWKNIEFRSISNVRENWLHQPSVRSLSPCLPNWACARFPRFLTIKTGVRCFPSKCRFFPSLRVHHLQLFGLFDFENRLKH